MLELSGDLSQPMRLSYGGDTLNTAIYLARLGVRTDYINALGDDPYSDWMRAQWQSEGVGVRHVIRAQGRLPGFYAIRTDDHGERQFHYWRDRAPARNLFDFPECDAVMAQIDRYDCLYFSGITLSIYSVAHRARLFKVLETARKGGCLIAFDSNYRERGWPDARTARHAFDEALARTDIALPTLTDEQALFEDADAAACARRLHAAGVSEVIVKLDAAGCLVSLTEEDVLAPTAEIRTPVDTTGAGDSFNAVYLAARLRGASAIAAAEQAHRLAAEVIMHPGAIIPRAAMPALTLPGDPG